jgi:hypothetical protein
MKNWIRRLLARVHGQRSIMRRRKIERAYRELAAAVAWETQAIATADLDGPTKAKLERGVEHMAAMALALGAVLQIHSDERQTFSRMVKLAAQINADAAFHTN